MKTRKGRRCSCRPAGLTCNTGQKCCSGICTSGTCGGVQTLRERGNGTATTQFVEGCETSARGCAVLIEGDITQGTPIAAGPFSGTVFASNFQQDPDGTSTNDVAGPITITQQGTGQQLRLSIDGRVVAQPSGAFVVSGTYQLIGGTGRFGGATGSGTFGFTGQGGDQVSTIETAIFSGTINYA